MHRSILLLIGIFLFPGIGLAQPGNRIPCDVKRQAFCMLKAPDGKCTLAAEILIGTYPKETDDRSATTLLNGTTDALKNEHPEWIILQRFGYEKAGALESILSLYASEQAVRSARSVYSDMSAVKSRANSIDRIQFITKSFCGNLVRVAYRPVPKEGRGFTFQARLTRTSKGYRFIAVPEEGEVFDILASAFPYWQPEREWSFQPDRSYTSVTVPMLTIPGSSGSSIDAVQSRAVVYARINFLPAGVTVLRAQNLTGSQGNVNGFLKQVITTYRTGTNGQILNLWTRATKREETQLSIDQGNIVQTREYFTTPEDFRIAFFVEGSEIIYVYFRPIEKGQEGHLKMLRFLRENGGLRLALDFEQAFLADLLMQNVQFARELEMNARR